MHIKNIILLSLFLLMTLVFSCKKSEETTTVVVESNSMPVPVLSYADPATSPSAYAIAYFLVSNLSTNSDTYLYLYGDAICSAGSLITSDATGGSSSGLIGVQFSGFGSYQIAVRYITGGSVSECVSLGYQLIAPVTPSGLSLSNPTTSPSTDSTPQIKVTASILQGHKVGVYTASNCSDASNVGLSSAAGSELSSMYITLNSLSVAEHTLYADIRNESANRGFCSTASVSYQVLPPGVGDQSTDGWYPKYIGLADFDNDGNQDIITTSGSKIDVMLGFGNGTVQTTKSQADEDGLSSAANFNIVDVDGDGKMDLLLGNYQTLNFFKGVGDGTFNAAVKTSTTAGESVSDISCADFDGDGDVDCAVSGAFNSIGSLLVYIGNGNGTFATGVSYATDRSLNALETADIDGDGDIDILAASTSGGSLAVYKNNGDGTFAAKVDYSSGTSPYRMTAGDLDGDADVDVIIMNLSDNNFAVLLNNGSGVFAAPATFGTFIGAFNYGYGMALGDINGDSKVDFVFGSGREEKYIKYLGNGDGTFAAGVDVSAIESVSSVVIGDMDGAGNPDIVYSIEVPSAKGKVDIDLN